MTPPLRPEPCPGEQSPAIFRVALSRAAVAAANIAVYIDGEARLTRSLGVGVPRPGTIYAFVLELPSEVDAVSSSGGGKVLAAFGATDAIRACEAADVILTRRRDELAARASKLAVEAADGDAPPDVGAPTNGWAAPTFAPEASYSEGWESLVSQMGGGRRVGKQARKGGRPVAPSTSLQSGVNASDIAHHPSLDERAGTPPRKPRRRESPSATYKFVYLPGLMPILTALRGTEGVVCVNTSKITVCRTHQAPALSRWAHEGRALWARVCRLMDVHSPPSKIPPSPPSRIHSSLLTLRATDTPLRSRGRFRRLLFRHLDHRLWRLREARLCAAIGARRNRMAQQDAANLRRVSHQPPAAPPPPLIERCPT